MTRATPLLAVRGVVKTFRGAAGRDEVTALDKFDLDVPRSSVVGLVGESGSGKSTLARIVTRLIEPDAGAITFDGEDLLAAAPRRLRELRRRIQLVFQDPGAALNPLMSVRSLVGEPLSIHRIARGPVLKRRVEELLAEVGLDASMGERRPGELSGGEKQRVAIARALALRPDLVVCDEPVSALDVSVQAQIIELLAELRRGREMSYLFISHDLGVVEAISDRIAVIYAGRLVESAPAVELARAPLHPYTRLLRRAMLPAAPPLARAVVAEAGENPVAAATDRPGCAFHTRCPFAVERCREEDPPLEEIRTGRGVACFRAEETSTMPLRGRPGGGR